MKSRKNPIQAQAGMEYLGIAVLVMAGILIGGPYVVRSINSQFKANEDAAQDAHRERIVQAPTQPEQIPSCDCNWTFVGCGTGAALDNGQTCGVQQNIYERRCSPLGCEIEMKRLNVFSTMQECRNDPTNDHNCCGPRTDIGCGAAGQPISGVACAATQMQWVENCGSPTPAPVYHCASDNTCITGCAAKDVSSTWCDPANYDKNLTAPNQSVRYVPYGSCNADNDMTCKAQCPLGTYAAPD